MSQDFIPTTEMERAYAQARRWPADRAWRRAYVEVSERRLLNGMGMYLCLLDHYARKENISDLFETCEWMLQQLEGLKHVQRMSVVRIVCHVVKILREDEIGKTRLKMILRIPVAVILKALIEERRSCAMSGLNEMSHALNESVTVEKLSEMASDFANEARSTYKSIQMTRVHAEMRAKKKADEKAFESAEKMIDRWREVNDDVRLLDAPYSVSRSSENARWLEVSEGIDPDFFEPEIPRSDLLMAEDVDSSHREDEKD